MDDQTATMAATHEREAHERKVRFVAEYMAASTKTWRGWKWLDIYDGARVNYLEEARNAIDACIQWDALHSSKWKSE